MARQKQIKQFSHKSSKRASAFISLKASVTLEAAVVYPLFLFAAVCLIYLLEVSAIRLHIRAGMHAACMEYAKTAYTLPVADAGKIRTAITESVGADKMERSIIKGGAGGIHTESSYVLPGSKVLKCKVNYELLLPILSFGRLSLSCEEEMQIKGFTGYTGDGLLQEKEGTVYITETGIVYHKNPGCTYLDLSIQAVSKGAEGNLRNENQEKYKACEICARKGSAQGKVYLTNSGNRYHNSLDCSGLKRSVSAVLVSEIGGRRPCSRCTQ